MTPDVRRPGDPSEPTNRELLDRIVRIEHTIDKVFAEHRQDHALIDSSIGELQRGGILREERISAISRAMPELGELHDFRVQVQMLAKTAQWIFGGSLLAAIAAIASLILSLSHFMSNVQ